MSERSSPLTEGEQQWLIAESIFIRTYNRRPKTPADLAEVTRILHRLDFEEDLGLRPTTPDNLN